jgi:hypothetical protein
VHCGDGDESARGTRCAVCDVGVGIISMANDLVKKGNRSDAIEL